MFHHALPALAAYKLCMPDSITLVCLLSVGKFCFFAGCRRMGKRVRFPRCCKNKAHIKHKKNGHPKMSVFMSSNTNLPACRCFHTRDERAELLKQLCRLFEVVFDDFHHGRATNRPGCTSSNGLANVFRLSNAETE